MHGCLHHISHAGTFCIPCWVTIPQPLKTCHPHSLGDFCLPPMCFPTILGKHASVFNAVDPSGPAARPRPSDMRWQAALLAHGLSQDTAPVLPAACNRRTRSGLPRSHRPAHQGPRALSAMPGSRRLLANRPLGAILTYALSSGLAVAGHRRCLGLKVGRIFRFTDLPAVFGWLPQASQPR